MTRNNPDHVTDKLQYLQGFCGMYWDTLDLYVAEKAGFEPALGINLNTLSRRAT